MSDAEFTDKGVLGAAGFLSVASHTLQGTYHGVRAHAGASPWEGVNALDALVSAYVNVSMLRQQILPVERIHVSVVEAPSANDKAIAALTRTQYTARSTTARGAKTAGAKIRRCMEAGAVATGRELGVEEKTGYADLLINGSLCEPFQQHMHAEGVKILKSQGYVAGATDQGDVSHAIPALHGVIGIPVDDGSKNHTPGLTKAAGSAVAHDRAVIAGKALAMTGWVISIDDAFYGRVKEDFESEKKCWRPLWLGFH